MSQQAIIECIGVCKQFGSQVILHKFDLSVRSGEFLTLLGPSGCGKTTLLRMLAGLEQADQGTILINQARVDQLPPGKRPLHLVFQNYALFPHLNVLDNVAFGLVCRGIGKKKRLEKTMQALSRVGMQAFAHRKPSELSGGQQQRVAIARAIVLEPSVLLLDEPLSALDYQLRKQMRLELKALQRRLDMTFIMVTHDQEEALSLSDRVVVMNQGRIEQIGTAREIYESPNNIFVTRFVGEANILVGVVEGRLDNALMINYHGQSLTIACQKQFETGKTVHIVIRPEDMEGWYLSEVPDNPVNQLEGIVREVIYKGSTVDLVVELKVSHEKILVTEFFDEKYDQLDYHRGEQVFLTWQSGWEVVLENG